jgi:hypothetical protein
LDGVAWAEIDRQTDNYNFKTRWATVSFDVSNSTGCRFIRLTQTDPRHDGNDRLAIRAFEIFGTLLK